MVSTHRMKLFFSFIISLSVACLAMAFQRWMRVHACACMCTGSRECLFVKVNLSLIGSITCSAPTIIRRMCERMLGLQHIKPIIHICECGSGLDWIKQTISAHIINSANTFSLEIWIHTVAIILDWPNLI